MKSVLVVAFDGLDKELIDEYGLEHVTLDEYGRIDNSTGVNRIITSELFASFITGTTWKEHGVTGLRDWDNPVLDFIENHLPEHALINKGAKKGKQLLTRFTAADKHTYTRDDIAVPTLFDVIPDSKALAVPSYTNNAFLDVYSLVVDQYNVEQAEREAVKEFQQRKEEFWNELDNHQREFFMAHFHYPDAMNHLFGEPVRDDDKLQDVYTEINEFSKEIRKRASGYDTIIFMSDHGLPTETGHNTNAFYSCNKELFNGKTPHITEFYDVILEHVDRSSADTFDELDV